MKRMLAVLALLPALARAEEIRPGTFSLRGSSNLGFDSSSVKAEGNPNSLESTHFGFDTGGLFYVIPNLGVGLTVGYHYLESKLDGQKSTQNDFVAGPAVAYDLPVAEKASLFLAGSFGLSSTKFSGGDAKGSGYTLALGGGIRYFVVPSFSIDTALAYQRRKVTYEGSFETIDNTSSGVGLKIGLSVYFGP